ncbi:MAG: hypothetical protein BWX95_02724 [Bacteroidetes bacterium ADurb.Bin141]|nr:MAG: hypothetical protein BWX95_02724 [Bacteroidetes bacterium ADurb.Bin141]
MLFMYFVFSCGKLSGTTISLMSFAFAAFPASIASRIKLILFIVWFKKLTL